jgi:hypothetical protein
MAAQVYDVVQGTTEQSTVHTSQEKGIIFQGDVGLHLLRVDCDMLPIGSLLSATDSRKTGKFWGQMTPCVK